MTIDHTKYLHCINIFRHLIAKNFQMFRSKNVRLKLIQHKLLNSQHASCISSPDVPRSHPLSSKLSGEIENWILNMSPLFAVCWKKL